MKNVHLIKTDKQSRLAYYQESTSYDKPILKLVSTTSSDYKYQNLYITNSEEIKKEEYYLSWQDYFNPPKFVVYVKSNRVNGDGKKIIFTTDEDLIKAGVQAIDEEFLEWFIKNPSCEEVDWNYKSNEFIQKELGTWGHDEGLLESEYNTYVKEYGAYKIIIQKKEPKQEGVCNCGLKESEHNVRHPFILRQETLEEAAEKYVDSFLFLYKHDNGLPKSVYDKTLKSFIEGAKWQKERMYSEEELEVAFFEGRENNLSFKEWLKQFKKPKP